MSTIKDVAERAKVSKTLVSRYINKKGGVGKEAQGRIESAIQELNYRPNALARSLVMKRTHSVGILIDDISSTFVVPLIEGFERGALDIDKEQQYTILYVSSNGNAEKKRRQLDYLTQGRVDGIILYGSTVFDDDLIRHLAQTNFPLVLVENDLSNANLNKIVIDNTGGAFTATEHLIKLGHRKIAHIGGDLNLKITTDRMNGFVNALQEYSIPIDRNLILFPDFTGLENQDNDFGTYRKMFYTRGYEEMQRLIQTDKVPDAVFSASDLSAFGAIRALTDHGLRVPEDVSVIGFDDETADASLPYATPITTMRQPLAQAGYESIQMLIGSLEHPGSPVQRRLLYTQLIKRQTTAQRQ